VHRDDRPQVYLTVRDAGVRWLSWVVRTPRSPESLVSEVRAALRRADPRLPLADVASMQAIIDDSLRQQRVSAVLIAGFALGALLLTAMGLFGVVAGAVTRRRHELAIRMALGADHHRVLRLVLSEGALLVGLGLVIGIPLIYFTGRTIAGVLIGISPFDPGTLGAVGLGLALVALAACYVPARRVTGIDPARSLGSE
jgi:putative ABC transport system permease protein